jgi:NAD(P)H-dependent FMN reductase
LAELAGGDYHEDPSEIGFAHGTAGSGEAVGCSSAALADRIAPQLGRVVILCGMSNILVFYGSYRSDRMGIRLAQFVIDGFRARGDDVEMIDAKAIGLPMLDRMHKEYPKGEAPAGLEKLAGQIRGADGFVFITGEYNWGIQPGLKNLTDHFLEEWFWRPAAIASYSAGRFAGARAAIAWHGTLSEMGMVVVSSTIAVGPIAQALSVEGKATGEGGKALERSFPRFADDLTWWMEAANAQRKRRKPPF